MSEGMRVRALGINHVALEVGDVDEALAFYGQVFELRLRGRAGSMAFVDLGDQFVALARGNGEPAGTHRHFGLVVEDKDAVRARLQQLGLAQGGGRNLRLHDPWGNVVEIVDYRDVQYAKRPEVLEAMRAEDPGKRDTALGELADKGIDVAGYRRAP
jgi:catechol 2,3-dioxygenase-like lactoylglutathione lyase family enzyme